MTVDRLEAIRRRMSKNKVYYSAYNPGADYLHDIEDAGEDFLWMIYEIERLREEARGLRQELAEMRKGS